MYWNGMSAWGWTLMTIAMVVFWGVLIAAGIALYRYLANRPQTTSTPQPPAATGSAAHQSPEQLLAERLARGDIDENEYHERLATLHGGARS